MPSKLNACSLRAATLAALLLLCAPGGPVKGAPTEGPAGDTSGEEGEGPSDLLSASPVWDSLLGATARHKKHFEDEFQHNARYHFLDNYRIPSFPAKCPNSNFSKEACLHRLVQGLFLYRQLLKFVEGEYPRSLIVSEARYHSSLLINLIKEKMKNRDKVAELSSSQAERLLEDLENPDAFHRKMMAHSILYHLHNFLVDGKRAVTRREMSRARDASKGAMPIGFYAQILKR